MSCLIIDGGKRLCGCISIQGAKNAVLPILSATLLSGSTSEIHNCPNLTDVTASLDILKFLGCNVRSHNGTISVNSQNACADFIPEVLMQKMRSSIIFAGSMLARCGRASVSLPGGCVLGKRPIDIHLEAFKRLGVEIIEANGEILCSLAKLKPCEICLPFPSVGATENIMLISCISDGVTTIKNAAKEPEIVNLQNFLNSMGADIFGAGSDTIVITGVRELHDTTYHVMPDRISACTYIAAAIVSHGEIELTNVNPAHFESVSTVFEKCGAKISRTYNTLNVKAPDTINPVPYISTEPYPGFPTDCQSVMMAVLAFANGKSIIEEKIFDQRFANAYELVKMGADIEVSGAKAYINGVSALNGAPVFARDLRSGAALAVAALGAEGTTEIFNTKYIDRGYENFEENLRKIGASIKRVEDAF